jgi:hypothetical protein
MALGDTLEARQAAIREEMTPLITISALPAPDREIAETINLLRQFLTCFIDEFEQALALFDHVQANNLPTAWESIAAKQAMLSIWHFGETLDVMECAFRKCQSLRALVGKHALRPAKGEFGVTFKQIEEVRNSGAHIIERVASPQSRKNDSINRTVLIISCLRERSLCYSQHGKEHCVDITADSLAHLKRIRSIVVSVFGTIYSKLNPASS